MALDACCSTSGMSKGFAPYRFLAIFAQRTEKVKVPHTCGFCPSFRLIAVVQEARVGAGYQRDGFSKGIYEILALQTAGQ